MGLLDLNWDALNSDQGRMALGLLAAAGPQERPMSFGQRLAGAMDQFRNTKAAEDERKLKAQVMQAQLEDIKAQALQRQSQADQLRAKAAEESRQRAILSSVGGQVTGVDANQVSGVTGPRPEAAAVIGNRQPIDYQSLIRQGISPDLVKSLAESRNYGRDKVARTVDGKDAQGRPVTYQQDEYGNTVGSPIQQWKAPVFEGLGDKRVALDPVTLGTLAQFKIGNSPDALLSAATTRRGQDMTDARSREKNAIDQSAVGKVDWKQDVNGNWIGLPKEITGNGPISPVMTTAPGKREQQARNALDIISEAEKLIDKGTGSYAGAAIDQGARIFGAATPGAVVGGQLKALEGALMMAQPRMEGPQSDKDVMLYRQMAAQIGDPTVPPPIKKAAIGTIKKLHAKYSGGQVEQAGPSLDDLLKKYGN